MLQIDYIKNNKELVIKGLQKRNFKPGEELIEQVILIDQKRRETQVEVDNLNAEANAKAKLIGQLMQSGQKTEAEKMRSDSSEMKAKVKELEQALKDFTEQRRDILVQIPNIPHESVPAGKSAEDNETVLEKGEIPTLGDWAVPHWDLIQKLDIIDFELGIKITGAGFPVYKGKGAKLQRALISFFLDEADKAGYREMQPPLLINRDSGFGTGQLPDKEGQMYYVTEDDLYLIPTAEVPITNLYRDVILNESDFPIKNVGYTQCFRREAGSWGAHVRGLNRLHQFDKVEIVQIQHPDKSYETLDLMCAHVQGLLEKLELPYRKLRLCGGDMGFTSALTYDMEVYSAAQKRWLEVSSVSNFETYQANRLQCRFRSKENPKNIQLVHTLNGSALALPRIVAAILENNQAQDGKIKIPAVLVPYTGFEWIG